MTQAFGYEMNEKKKSPLSKALRDDRHNRMSCIIAGLIALGGALFMLYKAHAAATEFISMLPLKETSLVFSFAFTAFACVGCLVFAVPLLVRAAMVGPQLKSNALLSERIEQIEKQLNGESEQSSRQYSNSSNTSCLKLSPPTLGQNKRNDARLHRSDR